MSKTRYEIEKLAAKIRTKHQANIDELQEMLNDAKVFLEVMPDIRHAESFEQANEIRYIAQCQQDLERMIKEERTALQSAYVNAIKLVENE